MRVTCAQGGVAASVRPKLFALSILEHIGRQSHVVAPPSADREVELSARRRTFLRRFRPVVSSITAAALVFAQLPTAQAASAMSRADYEACQARDEQGFRVAIEALTRRSLEVGVADAQDLVAGIVKRRG